MIIVRLERPGVASQTPGSELVAEMTPHAEDLLITKHTWGAFHETGLHETLSARGITTLVLAGIATNFGVDSTAREADENGYKLVFVEDAMAGMSERAHAVAVQEIFPQLGAVRSTEELLASSKAAGRSFTRGDGLDPRRIAAVLRQNPVYWLVDTSEIATIRTAGPMSTEAPSAARARSSWCDSELDPAHRDQGAGAHAGGTVEVIGER